MSEPGAPDDATPERIGAYRVVRRIATGGTSDVLLAQAEGPHGFQRTVVLKRLLAQFREDPTFERMFAREAAAYARLSHPAIVKLYDFFAAEGTLVIVLEYVDGLPLHRIRALLRQSGGELDDRSSLFIASRVFSALAAAHAARDPETGEFAPVIHRDVNPSNILVPWDGHAKLADFGIAKVTGVQGDTRAGYIQGTYGYMAPEQVKAETITHRADVYAAALVLWELLAKRKAIQRGALPEIEVMRAMAEPQLPSLDVLRPDLPASLRSALKRALEPVADRRAIFADELVAVLRASADLELGRSILADALMPLRPSPVAEDLAKTVSRTPPPPSIEPVTDATIVTEAAALPLPPPRPITLPPPPVAPVAPRPVHRAETRTVMGLGQTLAMSAAPPRPPPQLASTRVLSTPAPPMVAPPPPRFQLPTFPTPPVVNDGPVVLERVRSPPRRISTAALGAIVGVSVMAFVMVVGLLIIRVRTTAAPTTTPETTATSTSTATPTSTPTATSTATSTATATPTPSTSSSGSLDTSSSRPNHRVWVDGRVVGQTPGAFAVRCGSHAVRVGSQGTLRTVVVPCGGTVAAR